MKRSLLRKFQVVLLVAAIALTATAFLPRQANAIVGYCEDIGCYGGSFPCGFVIDPDTGQRVKCRMPCT